MCEKAKFSSDHEILSGGQVKFKDQQVNFPD